MTSHRPAPASRAPFRSGLSRRTFLSSTAGLAAALAWPAALAQAGGWSATWGTAPAGPPPASGTMAFSSQTLRLVARASIGGARVRVRLTNEMGGAALRIGAASIALRASGATVQAASIRALRFGGRAGAVVPPGAPLVSDPVALAVPAQADLVVSIYLPGASSAATMHNVALQTSYASTAGDYTASAGMPVARNLASWPFLSEIAVEGAAGCVVALGDSITDGQGSLANTNGRWPDHLARRLLAARPLPPGVVNRGISGNSLLTDYATSLLAGRDGLERFDRDVVATSGARTLVFLLGINDIVYSNGSNPVPAAELIAGYQQLTERARLRGLRVIGGTLLPFGGHGYYTAQREAVRQAVNAWMRSAVPFDGLADFDLALRDPARTAWLLPRYDSGDRLHPSPAGYEAMAAAVPLALL